MKRRIISVLITLIFALLAFYMALPAINLSNPGFYVYLCFVLMFYFTVSNITKERVHIFSTKGKIGNLVNDIWVLGVIGVIFVGIMLVNFVCFTHIIFID